MPKLTKRSLDDRRPANRFAIEIKMRWRRDVPLGNPTGNQRDRNAKQTGGQFNGLPCRQKTLTDAATVRIVRLGDRKITRLPRLTTEIGFGHVLRLMAARMLADFFGTLGVSTIGSGNGHAGHNVPMTSRMNTSHVHPPCDVAEQHRRDRGHRDWLLQVHGQFEKDLGLITLTTSM